MPLPSELWLFWSTLTNLNLNLRRAGLSKLTQQTNYHMTKGSNVRRRPCPFPYLNFKRLCIDKGNNSVGATFPRCDAIFVDYKWLWHHTAAALKKYGRAQLSLLARGRRG